MLSFHMTILYCFFKKSFEEKKEARKKKKAQYILDRSLDHKENKDSLKFKIHLQKNESHFEHFEEGFKST